MKRTMLSRGLAAALVAASLSAAVIAPSGAATTVGPVEAGTPPVVRDGSITLSVDRTAMVYTRSSSSAAYAPQSAGAVALAAAIGGIGSCLGDNPAGTNNSPRTTLTVTAPGGAEVLSSVSPVRDMGPSGLLTTPRHQPRAGATPSNTNFRGDVPDANAFHGMSATLDLTGKPAGVYTVTTRHTNKVKTGTFGACATGTPQSNGAGGFTNAAPTAGDKVETQTFEYRPWQHDFTDVLGGGKVSLNTTPAELRFSIGAKRTGVLSAPALEQRAYTLPDATSYALPTDAAACVANAASCLPPTAQECPPGSGCVPRLVLVSKDQSDADPSAIKGVFDLKTKAFIAAVKVGGSSRVLMSLGTENDATYKSVLDQLSAAASAQGVDLASILATKVSVGTGSDRTSVSLLNGLQIDPDNGKGGVTLSTGATAQAGVVFHLYTNLRSGTPCATNTASSATGATRYAKKEPTGYDVTTVDGLPSVPSVGALGALVGGPVHLIRGTFAPNALINTGGAALGVDTANGEPNGYPVWISPFLSGIHVAKPTTMEFLGTGSWSASETGIPGLGCLTLDLLVGTGVVLYDNPLAVGLKTLTDPLTQSNPSAVALAEGVDDLVEQVTSTAVADPTVSSVLTQVIGALPLSGLPTTP